MTENPAIELPEGYSVVRRVERLSDGTSEWEKVLGYVLCRQHGEIPQYCGGDMKWHDQQERIHPLHLFIDKPDGEQWHVSLSRIAALDYSYVQRDVARATETRRVDVVHVDIPVCDRATHTESIMIQNCRLTPELAAFVKGHLDACEQANLQTSNGRPVYATNHAIISILETCYNAWQDKAGNQSNQSNQRNQSNQSNQSNQKKQKN